MGIAIAILLAVLVLLAPLIVAKTSLRDRVINAILASPSVKASSSSASFRWFSPLSIRGLQLNSTNKRIDIRVDEITAERSPWRLLISAPNLGTIRVTRPYVRLELPLDVKIERLDRLEPIFTAVVTDAALTVRAVGLDEPVIDVDDLNMTIRAEQAADGRLLTLDPLVIFDRRKLSPKLRSKLLYLIDPTLGDAARVAGEVSLTLAKFRLPLGIPRDQLAQNIEVEGTLALHQISTEVANPISQALVQLLCDMYGKEPQEVTRVVEDAEIRFQVREGRLFHEGLRLGFPEIDPGLVITSRGSVGLDQTLDLELELPRLDKAKRKEKGPAKCRITGTIRNPKAAVQDGSFVVRLPDCKEPIIAVDGINLNMEVKDSADVRVLVLEPVDIFKKAKLDVELTSPLIRLIEPDLVGNPQVTGEVTLSIDKLQLPLGVPQDQVLKHLEVEGKLTLHQVSSEAKNPVRLALIQLLADMYGKQASEVVQVVQNAEIRFQVRNGRLFYEGFRFGLPEIDPDLVVQSRGSIGLDETLDLTVELPRLRKEKQEHGPIQCQITGTIYNPRVSVKDTSLVVNLACGDKPTLRVANVDLTFDVEQSKDGRWLTLLPVTLFNRQKLTSEISDELIQLIAPTLGDVAGVEGEISLSLETFRVPLGVKKAEFVTKVELAGKLQLHQISAAVKTPLLEATVKVLADMHGKKPSDVVRVIEDAEVHFQFRQGRLHHEGLRLGLPDISQDLLVSSRGSVGLDHSLDMVMEVPRAVSPLKQVPVDGKESPVRLRITGTIENPIVTEIKDEKD